MLTKQTPNMKLKHIFIISLLLVVAGTTMKVYKVGEEVLALIILLLGSLGFLVTHMLFIRKITKK
ncbi:MAG TPA: hypothetical protein PKW37_05145 [Salinivirgaceae bacterium]|nr:hypothetical protein [Salinivirgaceae bacterium]